MASEAERTAPQTLNGAFALHDIRTIDWAALAEAPRDQGEAAAASLAAYAAACEAAPEPAAAGHDSAAQAHAGPARSAAYRVVGHKGDLLFLHFRETVAELAELERRFEALPFAAFTHRAYSYLSVVELSRHAAVHLREGGLSGNPEVARRLHPTVPDRSHICFYPMSKRRGETVNWYLLASAERRRLMGDHGRLGHSYAERVTQIITGSTGLDDWEWGVSLFGNNPVDFKDLIYEMRFDEASAAYAEFGPFYVGIRTAPSDWPAWLAGAHA